MREADFELKVKSGGWTHHPDRWNEPDARMVSFTLVALRDGRPLGGHNIQAHVGSATSYRGASADVDVWLSSGWWVTFRNEFAQAPEAGAKLIGSIDGELSRITAELENARGSHMVEAKDKLWETTFGARGSDYWR